MKITILGSGTSTGVPVIGCDCPVCRSDAPENKRLRSSIYVENGDDKILIDCSSDFRQQALRAKLPRIDAVFLTHDHADHINGIDDLRLFNFIQRNPIDLYAREDVVETVKRRYEYCFNPRQLGGGVPQLNLRPLLPGETVQLKSTAIQAIPIKHGILDIFGFRIGKRFAYLTDCSEVPESSVELLEGVEVLVVDALRKTPHSTHFSLSEALDFSRRIQPRQTWFTHIACRMDHFETNEELPDDAQLLYDGQVIEVNHD